MTSVALPNQMPASTSWRGRVALVAKPGGPNTGVGRYVHMLQTGLQAAGAEAVRVAPSLPPLPSAGYRLLQRLGLDARAFFNTYPVWARYPKADVYHLTSQNLASLLLFRRPPGRVVVTVHDIIPYMLRDDPQLSSYRGAADRLFDRLAMAGLRRADALIAVSHFTKECSITELGLPKERFAVIHEAIEQMRFRPLSVSNTTRQRYRLLGDERYLLYVGSEDPRKNIHTLIRAFALVQATLPNVRLIKVGKAHFEHERAKLTELALSLGVLEYVYFLDDVPEDVLPEIYNLADICVMPSLYEGFGLPVLEAMSCERVTIAANAGSLPEILGNGGLLFEPEDSPGLAQVIKRVLTDHALSSELRLRAAKRATDFVADRHAAETLAVYEGLIGLSR